MINKIDNTAYLTYKSKTYNSNTVSTILLLPPFILIGVDKEFAYIGEIITYVFTIENLSLVEVRDLDFEGIVPEGTTYLQNSFIVGGVNASPAISENSLKYKIPSIASETPMAISFQVMVNESVLDIRLNTVTQVWNEKYT